MMQNCQTSMNNYSLLCLLCSFMCFYWNVIILDSLSFILLVPLFFSFWAVTVSFVYIWKP